MERSAAPDGSLADIFAPTAPAPAWREIFTPAALLRLAVLAGLLVALHFKLLEVMALKWRDPNWAHGYIIPLFSLYLLYSRREELFAAVGRARDGAERSPARTKRHILLAAVIGAAVFGLIARLLVPQFAPLVWKFRPKLCVCVWGAIGGVAGPFLAPLVRRLSGRIPNFIRRPVLALSPRGDLAGVAGLALMLLCLAAEVLSVLWIHNWWLAQVAMVGLLFGLVLYLAGPGVIRVTWLPILFLLFAMPIPDLVYARVAVPLQNLAAKGAVVALRVAGVDIYSTASNLQLISREGHTHGLTVAEACSGMRMLMAFLALGVAMAYLDDKPVWQRAILVVLAVPIAVFCNVLRVSITCWMFYIDKPELGQDFMHTFTGILMLIPAFLLLWALAWILRNLFVADDLTEPEATP